MAQAAVNVHTLPKSSNLSRDASQKRIRRLVQTLERIGALIYLTPARDRCFVVWGHRDDVDIAMSIWWRFHRLDKPMLYAYLARSGRTYENARLDAQQRQLKKAA